MDAQNRLLLVPNISITGLPYFRLEVQAEIGAMQLHADSAEFSDRRGKKRKIG